MLIPAVVFLTSFFIGVHGQIPVFVWGSPSEQKPALYTMKQNEFAKIMEPKFVDSMVAVFLEPELNTIDFRSKTENSESCYSNLKKFPDYTYFTSVVKPVEALRELTDSQEYAIVNENGYLEPSIKYQIGKLVIIQLKNTGVNRSMLLKKHDDTINKIYEQLSSFGKVTGLYTSSSQPTQRIRRTTKDISDGGVKFLKPEFLLYFKMLSLKESESKPVALKVSNMDVKHSNDSLLSVTLTTDRNPLTFDVVQKNGYYEMKNVKYGDQMYLVSSGLGAPIGFSYAAGVQTFTLSNPNPINSQSTTSQIIWKGLQIQPHFKQADEKDLVFSEAWDSTGYFTPGILMGLFVVFILLIILGVAIACVMDINTMDRFENNRSGKTITINASD